MSTAEADRFLGALPASIPPTPQGFELRHHQPNDSTGFSASVFFDKSQNKYVLGIRGTENIVDILEDVNRIGVQGYAGDQAVALYRYYRKLTTAPGQPVSYSDSEVALLSAMRLGVLVNANAAIRIFGRSKLRAELAADVGSVPPNGSSASVLQPGAPLTVTGHSLGGHLALLFGRFFPDVAEHVYTYNAPGIGLQGELALRLLGISPIEPGRVTNIASMMGNEAISRIWSKPGENIGVATETGTPLYKHSIVPLTDTLALYGAIATLSPGLAGDPAAVSGMISAASPYSEESLEAVLDALRAPLGVDGAPTLIARTLADLDARDSYHQNLHAVLDARTPGHDYRIESLVGKSAGELASMAASEASVRFALHELAPFAAMGADYADFEDSFSGQWLASRADLLAAMLEGNLVDHAFGLSGTTENVLFRDVDSGLQYSTLNTAQENLATPISSAADRDRLQQFLDGVAYNRTVVFGSDSPGALLGLAGGDRLFGAAGDDSLDGAGGDDYLEGGAGADTLIGGAGDDTLDGGEGSDLLEGGAGDDNYVFEAGFDGDTIVDRDGAIYAGTYLLTGGSGGVGGQFESGDGQFSFSFPGDLASAGTLTINGSLRVEGFRNGDLGIRLVRELEHPDPWIPVAEIDLFGDIEYEDLAVSPGVYITRDQYGNPRLEMHTVPAPGRADLDWEFPGTPGNTHFVLGAGNDISQDVLGGDDYIELGGGDDAGFGGRGNDLVEGGAGKDLVAGGRGDDLLFAGTLATMESDLDEYAIGTGSNGGDYLSGGDGDDTIVGDAENNLIEGGAGRDRIFGGAGHDQIGADATWLSGAEQYGIDGSISFAPGTAIDVMWTASHPPGIDQFSNMIGSVAGADFIDAGSGNDLVYAGGGDDVVFGGTGDDTIFDGEGADTVYAGDGADQMYVGAANDTSFDYIDGGAGDDLIQSLFAGSRMLLGGAGNDILLASGGLFSLLAGDGNDTLRTLAGGGMLDGGAGNDALAVENSQGGRTEVRWGRGSGADVGAFLYGTVSVDAVGVLPGELAVSMAQVPFPNGQLPGIEFRLRGTQDSLSVLRFSGIPGISELQIDFADGTIWNWQDIDELLETSEEPGTPSEIAGSDAAEMIFGSAGADTLAGSGGNDWLKGGEGNDVYRYAMGNGFDVIEDVDPTPGNTDALAFGSGIDAQDIEVLASGDDYILALDEGGVRLRGGRSAAGAIERVEFADGTLWTPADVAARAVVLPDNHAPQTPASLGSIEADPGTRVSFSVPQGSIVDPDRFDSLQYYAITADGDRLPDWLEFDAATLTIAGTPGAQEAGTHEFLLIAVDQSGAAATSSLTVVVSEAEVPVLQLPGSVTIAMQDVPVENDVPVRSTVPAVSAAIDIPSAPRVPDPAPGPLAIADTAAFSVPVAESTRVGVPLDPLFRDMQQRFDVLLQVGRTNLGEGYADAIREFEERRMEREEPPLPPPPSDEEVAAWNSAMHAWHERNPGFAETDLGGNDGTWTMGWGLPGPGDRSHNGVSGVGAIPGLGNPNALSRLPGADSAPGLAEGVRDLR